MNETIALAVFFGACFAVAMYCATRKPSSQAPSQASQPSYFQAGYKATMGNLFAQLVMIGVVLLVLGATVLGLVLLYH